MQDVSINKVSFHENSTILYLPRVCSLEAIGLKGIDLNNIYIFFSSDQRRVRIQSSSVAFKP